MRLKQATLYIGLLFVAASISGCVYLRLLQVKRQLNDFNSYFRINDQNGFSLVFLKPVLNTEDVLWLVKHPPTSKEQKGEEEVWTYLFEKDYRGQKSEEGDFDIPVVMSFEKGKLREIRFPERFLKVLSKPLLVRMFESMGSAEINKLSRSASSKFEGKDSMEIPRKAHVTLVLGKPFYDEVSRDDSIFTYQYDLKNDATNPKGKEFNLWMKFTFDQRDERLLKVDGNFSRLKVSIDFSVNGSNEIKNGKGK
jgi:uncharacterized protein YxeA